MNIKLVDIDVHFSFTSDTPNYYNNFWKNNYGMGLGSNDPDSKSKTLRLYHKLLWSKKLPNGEQMNLEYGKAGKYLVWKSFVFGSDSITASFKYKRNKPLIDYISSIIPNYKDFVIDYTNRCYTIGGMMIFPKRSGGINQSRGMNIYICDRIDLTLECIRRYYNNEDSPLYNVLLKDKEFFDLFVNFKGFVDYFFLNDLVTDDYKHLKFLIGNGEFVKNPIPKTFDEYMTWMNKQQEFLEARNNRIKEYIESI